MNVKGLSCLFSEKRRVELTKCFEMRLHEGIENRSMEPQMGKITSINGI